jgi:CheY-like chemotaxis protein
LVGREPLQAGPAGRGRRCPGGARGGERRPVPPPAHGGGRGVFRVVALALIAILRGTEALVPFGAALDLDDGLITLLSNGGTDPALVDRRDRARDPAMRARAVGSSSAAGRCGRDDAAGRAPEDGRARRPRHRRHPQAALGASTTGVLGLAGRRADVIAARLRETESEWVSMAARLMIVDDNPHFLAAARDLLERQGLAVLAVTSTGEDAALLVQELGPDCVLVDVDLGPESGFDVARLLAGEHGVPVVLISANSESDFPDLIAASPALGFISKAELSAARVNVLLGEISPG